MAIDDPRADNEALIREIIERRVQAIHAKDVAGAVAGHAPDVSMFDVVSPLQYAGAAAVEQRAGEWFSAYPGAIGYEVRDLVVRAGEWVAYCHYLYRVTGTTADGTPVDMWVRATACFDRVDGAWLISHEHQSVPFDPATGKASLDLKP
jgi:ketosteroid isomerase-like protein